MYNFSGVVDGGASGRHSVATGCLRTLFENFLSPKFGDSGHVFCTLSVSLNYSESRECNRLNCRSSPCKLCCLNSRGWLGKNLRRRASGDRCQDVKSGSDLGGGGEGGLYWHYVVTATMSLHQDWQRCGVHIVFAFNAERGGGRATRPCS